MPIPRLDKQRTGPILIALALVCMAGCGSRSTTDISEYLSWMNDPDNGLTCVREINDLKISVRYLAPEYRAYLDMDDRTQSSQSVMDSLTRLHAQSTAFMVTIAPAEGRRDVMMRNVSTYSDYVDRVMTMNFGMSDQFKLIVDGTDYRPILATPDNDYGMSGSRTITVMFANQADNERPTHATSYDFVLSDMIFETGLNHFVFSREDMENRPRLVL